MYYYKMCTYIKTLVVLKWVNPSIVYIYPTIVGYIHFTLNVVCEYT